MLSVTWLRLFHVLIPYRRMNLVLIILQHFLEYVNVGIEIAQNQERPRCLKKFTVWAHAFPEVYLKQEDL